jgi:uncharacterized membrane protein
MSDWYYAADNQQKGPVNESELKANLASGKLPADALVWKDGMDNWTPANQVPAFTFRPSPTPAAIQPSIATTKADPDVNNPESTKPVNMKSIMGTPEALEVNVEDADTNKVFGILAYLGPLCFIPIIVAKDSPYAKYHANQGLVLFLAWVASLVVLGAGLFLPFGLGYIFALLHYVVYLVIMVLAIIGIINAAAGKCVPLPVIGGIKLLK